MNNEIEFSQKDTINNNDYLNAQIVSVGMTTENVYKILLAPEIDMSTLKITVKFNNLRVEINRLLNYHFNKSTNEILDETVLKKNSKHIENFLIPNFIDAERVQKRTEMRLKGLKLIASELTSGSILNIRLQEEKEPYIIRNINFLIPTEADANLVSIEMFNDDIIAIRVPLRVNPCN
ncbi:hypothetical protein PV327_006609 [Microctonus hyperodae]|uniref:Uncharacterized protein n=1 Tax=Microctonus hyperodae TaxID=165561 RepID=A0AA39KIN8_MICHY|nr:hypothetical protein PV327_006609 [Microctonus hyperodae]